MTFWSPVQSGFLIMSAIEGIYPVGLQLRDKLHSPGVRTIFENLMKHRWDSHYSNFESAKVSKNKNTN